MRLPRALLVLFFLGVAALAQERPTVNAQANTVFVGADGKLKPHPIRRCFSSMSRCRMKRHKRPIKKLRKMSSRCGKYCGRMESSRKRHRLGFSQCNRSMTGSPNSTWSDIA